KCEPGLPFRNAAAAENLVAEHECVTVIVQSRTMEKHSLLVRLLNGPTRATGRDVLNIALRVTAIDAEGAQLHQLARVGFIQTAVDSRGLGVSRRIRTWHARAPAVDVEEHPRRLRC